VAERTRIAWYGTGVTTVEVAGEHATIEVATELINETADVFDGVLAAKVLLPGAPSVTVTEPVSLAPRSVTVHRQRLQLNDVRLWHPDSPVCCTLDQTLGTADRAGRHRATTEFGIRTIEFTTADGFFLNG